MQPSKEEIIMSNIIKWTLKVIYFGALAGLCLWVFASWVDIVTHNMNPDPIYKAWNFFTLCI